MQKRIREILASFKRKKKTESYIGNARIVRFDGNGKKKQYLAKAANKTHARQLRTELEQKYDQRGERAIEGDKMLFRKFADLYRMKKLIPAQYHGTKGVQRKIAGLRSVKPVLHYCDVLVEYFGAYQLKTITHGHIEDFKSVRLNTPSRRGIRSIADVNRTLALLRSMMQFAIQNRWITQSPFELGKPLLSIADEAKRERVLTFNEEARLLDVCMGERVVTYIRKGKEIQVKLIGGRGYLKALIVTALDTAMRKGELLKLQWKDVNFPCASS